MSGNDEKLPYLHEITKRKFLVSDTNMGLCLYMDGGGWTKRQRNGWDPKLIRRNIEYQSTKFQQQQYNIY